MKRPIGTILLTASALLLLFGTSSSQTPWPEANALELTGSFICSWSNGQSQHYLRSDGMIARSSDAGVFLEAGVSRLGIGPVHAAHRALNGSIVILPSRDRQRLYRVRDGVLVDSVRLSTLGWISALSGIGDRTLYCTSEGEVVLTKPGSFAVDSLWTQYSVTCASATETHVALAGRGFVRILGHSGVATDTAISISFGTGPPSRVAMANDASVIAVSVRSDSDSTFLGVSKKYGPLAAIDTTTFSYLLVPKESDILAFSKSSTLHIEIDTTIAMDIPSLRQRDVFAFEPQAFHYEGSTLYACGTHAFIGAWTIDQGWSIHSYIPQVPTRSSVSIGSADRGLYIFQGFGGTLLKRRQRGDTWIPLDVRGACLPQNTTCKVAGVAPDSTVSTLWNEVHTRTVVSPSKGIVACATEAFVVPSFWTTNSIDTLVGYDVLNKVFVYSTNRGADWNIYFRPATPPDATIALMAFEPGKATWAIDIVKSAIDTATYRNAFVMRLLEYRGGELVRSTEFPDITSLRSWVVRGDTLYAIALSNEIAKEGATSLVRVDLSDHSATELVAQKGDRFIALALHGNSAFVSDFGRNLFHIDLLSLHTQHQVNIDPPLSLSLSWIAVENDTTLIVQTSSTPFQQLLQLTMRQGTTSIRDDAAPREGDAKGAKTYSLDVAPNPASSMIMIALPSVLFEATTQSARISVVDILGNEIHQETVVNSDMSHNSGIVPTHRIDCNNWIPGVYVITITTGRAAAHGRVIRH